MNYPIQKLIKSNDIFSVISVNLAMNTSPHALDESFHFMHIWKSKIPKKMQIQIFLMNYHSQRNPHNRVNPTYRLKNICLNPNWCIMYVKIIMRPCTIFSSTILLFYFYGAMLRLTLDAWINNTNSLRDLYTSRFAL